MYEGTGCFYFLLMTTFINKNLSVHERDTESKPRKKRKDVTPKRQGSLREGWCVGRSKQTLAQYSPLS